MATTKRRQKQKLTAEPKAKFGLKTKCVTMLVYEEEGKTVLQPLTAEEETQTLQELFQNTTLEVWLPNGKSTIDEYNVSIIQYKPKLKQLPSIKTRRSKPTVFPWSNWIGKKWGCMGSGGLTHKW
ncbi:MAG: hypothetical protein N3D85_02775 [Candidatus Bathyarchaeota archaeon]|nr:hypothetical protein [Candidatus Bathyarchaeota archaeon]